MVLVRVLLLWTVPVLAAAAPTVARAQMPAAATPLSWHCVQEFDEHANVMCIPRLDSNALTEPAQAASTMPAISARRAGGSDLRPVAHRGDAEVFAFEAWRVPLLVPPVDYEHVELLLKSVLCGRRPACSVHYRRPDTAHLHADLR